jgi:hypothetical protein
MEGAVSLPPWGAARTRTDLQKEAVPLPPEDDVPATERVGERGLGYQNEAPTQETNASTDTVFVAFAT